MVAEGNLLGIADPLAGFTSSGFNMDTLDAGWHHLAAVRQLAPVVLFYIDGALVGQCNVQLPALPVKWFSDIWPATALTPLDGRTFDCAKAAYVDKLCSEERGKYTGLIENTWSNGTCKGLQLGSGDVRGDYSCVVPLLFVTSCPQVLLLMQYVNATVVIFVKAEAACSCQVRH